MRRKPVPPMALLLSAGTGLAGAVVAISVLRAHGQAQFFDRGDARMFWLTTRDLFGTGRGFAALGRASEIPYRYGRMGLPLVAWALAAGRPGLSGGALIGVNILAIAAIPGLAATLLDDNGAPALAGAVVFLSPGLLVLTENVVAEPLLVALILLAYLLDGRNHPRAAIGVLAYAILVKEVAMLALIPMLGRAVRARDGRGTAAVAAALVPYAAWCVWVRGRVGALPFLAHATARRGALSLPFVGIHDVMSARTPDHLVIVTIVIVTALFGACSAWVARRSMLGVLAGLYALLCVCLGPEALRFEGETIRVLVVPQIVALVALALAVTTREPARA